jgi:hypothetical protein
MKKKTPRATQPLKYVCHNLRPQRLQTTRDSCPINHVLLLTSALQKNPGGRPPRPSAALLGIGSASSKREGPLGIWGNTSLSANLDDLVETTHAMGHICALLRHSHQMLAILLGQPLPIQPWLCAIRVT